MLRISWFNRLIIDEFSEGDKAVECLDNFSLVKQDHSAVNIFAHELEQLY